MCHGLEPACSSPSCCSRPRRARNRHRRSHHGYVEGNNVNLVFRWAETAERLPEVAADLVRLKVDLIFAPTSTEVEAARQATRTIPIVFAGHADPVGVGHLASLAAGRHYHGAVGAPSRDRAQTTGDHEAGTAANEKGGRACTPSRPPPNDLAFRSLG